MAKWRSLLPLILFCSTSVGQTEPDFSGVFFRSGIFTGKANKEQKYQPLVSSPLVLIIKQTDGCLFVSEMQNGATRTSSFRLRESESKNVDYTACQKADSVKLKHQTLLIDSAVRWSSSPPFDVTVEPHTKQSWEISPDLQTLTITQPFMFSEHEVENYTRLPSLEAAMARAESESEMNTCNALPTFSKKSTDPNFDEGLRLGVTGFQQFGRFVLFDAGVAGPFFHGLIRVDKPSGPEFRRNGQLVQSYPDSLVLEIEPRINSPLDWMGGLPTVPAQLLDLRFHLKWAGAETRDLGDFRSEPLTEPWPELRAPRRWYRLEVPSYNVPLTDNLEIRILSNAGKQIGCITGHI